MEINNEVFYKTYKNRKNDVMSFLLKTDAVAEEERKPFGNRSNLNMHSMFNIIDDDLITLLDVLYYVGRDIRDLLIELPNEGRELKETVINACVENMKADRLSFGLDNGYDINIYGKSASAIIENVSVAAKAIETGSIA